MSRDPHDSDMLKYIGQCNPNVQHRNGMVMIFDSRPQLNAVANKLKGGGYEDCGAGKSYPDCQLQFCNIENIHEVQKAYNLMCQIAYKQNKDTWLSQIGQTGYQQVLQFILDATNDMLKALTQDLTNVMVHCSDGWDRTSQMSALTQLMLDPYYRTIEGF